MRPSWPTEPRSSIACSHASCFGRKAPGSENRPSGHVSEELPHVDAACTLCLRRPGQRRERREPRPGASGRPAAYADDHGDVASGDGSQRRNCVPASPNAGTFSMFLVPLDQYVEKRLLPGVSRSVAAPRTGADTTRRSPRWTPLAAVARPGSPASHPGATPCVTPSAARASPQAA